MIAWILFITWVIGGPFIFMKIINLNNGKINKYKINLLVLISGPFIWIIKLYKFVGCALKLLYRLILGSCTKLALWFGE